MIVRSQHRSGVVLIAVLLVVALLSLAAYQYSDFMMSEYKAADSAARAAQARLFAASGVHYAAALLSNTDSYQGTLSSNPFDNPSAFKGVYVNEGAMERYSGYFSIVSPYTVDETSMGGSGQFRYGVLDEASKINPNMIMQVDPTGQKLHDMLMKLPNMTEEIADAIVDWIDADDEPRTSGAESSYYSALSPGYRCKNGPLDSIEELLFVRGVTTDLLFGSDRNRNGSTDRDEENDGEPNDRGWSQYLTVYSRERNIDVDGNPRIYLNDTDTDTLYTNMVTALGTEMADFLLAYKLYGAYTPQSSQPSPSGQPGQGNQQTITRVINSVSPVTKDLLDSSKKAQAVSTIFGLVSAKVGISKTTTTVSQTSIAITTQGGNTSVRTGPTQTTTTTVTTVYTSPLSDPAKAKQLLPILLDKFTTRKDAEIPARININTAPAAVITTLPGLSETDAQTLLQARPVFASPESTDDTYASVAWLYTEAKISPATIQTLERYITAKPQVFRVQSIGYFERGGPAARIEAVIDTNAGQPRIVYWRDITELSKGFNLQSQ